MGALRAEQSTNLLCCRGLVVGLGCSELLALPTHTHLLQPILHQQIPSSPQQEMVAVVRKDWSKLPIGPEGLQSAEYSESK